MKQHIVVELPTGDWAVVPEGSTINVYLLNDEALDQVANGGMKPGEVDAIDVTRMDLSTKWSCSLCGEVDGHRPGCPKARRK